MVETVSIAILAAKVQRRAREYGLAGAARYSVMRAIDLCQGALFDLRHGVDTGGAMLPEVEGGQGYKGSLPSLVSGSLRRVDIPYEHFTFIDLGSGKGRTLLIAARFPFRKIVGVEFVPELHRIAEQNIRRCKAAGDIVSLCGDVRDFAFPPGPLLVYLFNPFTEPVLRRVLQNLRESLDADPRPVVLVYLRPLHAGEVERCDFLRKADHHRSRLIGNFDYAIYRNALS
jgi:SAM-dependent methyltransferase